MKIKWSGLADAVYWEGIAKYCVPSWEKLPGKKYIVHDSNLINYNFLNIVNWAEVGNYESGFWKIQRERKKTNNFWRKMQSQVWAVRNLTNCDFVALLDTDIEVLDFDQIAWENQMDQFVESGHVWATGRSQSRLHDSGMIVLNMKHPQLHQLIDEYENIWNSGEIFNLRKSYDGIAVESLFDKWPSYKIMNIDWGSGFHTYDVGFVHYGSKIPKQRRIAWPGDGKSLVEDFTKNLTVKHYKN